MRIELRTLSVAVLAGLVSVLLPITAASGQVGPPGRDAGLMPLIPPNAVFFLERRGHQAVREAFLASNLGRVATDDAIHQFVHDSRRRIGRMIVARTLNLVDAEEIERHRKLLHEVLKPFWHKPAAMFVVLDAQSDRFPSLGFFCAPGKEYDKSANDALAALMKTAGARTKVSREVTHTTGMFTWRAVAGTSQPLTLPADPKDRAKELRKHSLSMVSRSMSLLTVVTDLAAAEAMENALARSGKDENPSAKTVMAKTAMKDWAFRWYFDCRALEQLARARKGRRGLARVIRTTGLDSIRGMGGTGGYVDKVYARLTYVDAPGATGGFTRLFRRGGSYRRGLSMVPAGASFCLAGEFDTEIMVQMLRSALVPEAPATKPGAPRPRAGPEPSDKTRKVVRQIALLARASDGHACGYVAEVPGMMGMMAPGGVPFGMVLGLRDRAQAAKAIDELVKLTGPPPGKDGARGPMPGAAMPRQYRKVSIRYAGRMPRFALMEDRVVIAFGDEAVKAAIDSALDGTGGFEPDSKEERLARSLGRGPGVFSMDLRAVARLTWPMMIQMAQMEEAGFPFTSVPSTTKMSRVLGPEIAVFEPQAGGLMIRSRGTIPFATKISILYAMVGLLADAF